MSHITDMTSQLVSDSRNLRGLRDYARRSPVACIITRADGAVRGELTVVYADGNIGRATWCSHHILIDWVRNRRTWRGAVVRHLDDAMGYLTKPGLIVGD